MMTFIIENESGQFWTGKCWGTKQAAAEYCGIRELPHSVPDSEGNKHRFWWNAWEQLDAGYGLDIYARVRRVR